MNVLVRDQTDKLIIAGYYFAGRGRWEQKSTDRQTDTSVWQDRHKIHPLHSNKKDRKADRKS